jgi:hypothetical protein
MLDADGFIEAFRYCAAFWYFALNPDYRQECMEAWRTGDALRRGALALHAVVAIACGVSPVGLLIYFAL